MRTIEVTFLKSYRSFSVGEKAVFVEAVATQLVADGTVVEAGTPVFEVA